MRGKRTISIESISESGECLGQLPFKISPWTGNPTEKLVLESYDALIAHFKRNGEAVGGRDINFLEDGILATKVSESYFIGRCFVDNWLFPVAYPRFVGSYVHSIYVVGSERDVRDVVSEVRMIAAEKDPKLRYDTWSRETYKMKGEVDLHELVTELNPGKYDKRMELLKKELKQLGGVVK